MEREKMQTRVINSLAHTKIFHSFINSELARDLIGLEVSNHIRLLQNPTNESVLKSINRLERLAGFLIPNDGDRTTESHMLVRLKNEFARALETGTDTNFTRKIKRTLGLMNEKTLRMLLLDFGAIRFGIGKLNRHFQEEPYVEELAMQINSECNARPRCPGCFTRENKGTLTYETQDKVIAESINLGSKFTNIIGGEPLLEKDNLFKLFRKYNRMPFIVFTNGILLDEAYAKKAADLENVITLINIPGLKITTTKIRGDLNAWDYITKAAKNLRKYQAASGFSSTVYQTNFKDVSSSEFVEQMIDFEMMIGFYFPYTDPVGCSPQKELTLTAQTNEDFSQRIKFVSNHYPLILVDATGEKEKKICSCIDGKVRMPYIQSDGNVAGCPMAPQLNNGLNVHDVSLKDILLNPYFELIRSERPSCMRDPDFLEKLKKLA